MHGDARSGYQAVEVRLSDPAIPPYVDAHGHTGTVLEMIQTPHNNSCNRIMISTVRTSKLWL